MQTLLKQIQAAKEIENGKQTHPIFNLHFLLLCFSSMLFSASYNMLIPELPSYLSSLGGADYKGLIISLFTLTAGLSRPISGQLIDTVGRKPVLLIGTIVCLICGFLYPVLGSVAGFLLLRLFHGFSTGFNPTAMTAYVSDVVPPNRWGEALGWQGLFYGMGLALGPALGSFIKLYFSFDVLFYSSSFVAFLSFALIFTIKETLTVKKPFTLQTLKISRQNIFASEAVSPAIVTFLTYFAFGMVLTLIPDWSQHLGIAYKGLFFILFTIASLLVRLFAGKFSDSYGRVPLIFLGLAILLISMLVMGYFPSITGLVIASLTYGTAMGILSPALNAWTVDLSLPSHKGRAIATMFIGMEAGIGLGALFSGFYYQNILSRIPQIMLLCAVTTLFAIIYLQLRKRFTGRKQLPIEQN
ncbi:MAG: MFS transporter [Pyrinomonadaceae bacterium]|nr:MFS transporter [Pyrinomonadaceae bacterium]